MTWGSPGWLVSISYTSSVNKLIRIWAWAGNDFPYSHAGYGSQKKVTNPFFLARSPRRPVWEDKDSLDCVLTDTLNQFFFTVIHPTFFCLVYKLNVKCSLIPLYRCLAAKLCLTLCNHMDCSPPGSSVHGILQGRNPSFLPWQEDSLQLSHQGSPIPLYTLHQNRNLLKNEIKFTWHNLFIRLLPFKR